MMELIEEKIQLIAKEVLEAGAMAGEFFETFVIAEVLKSYYNTDSLEISKNPLNFITNLNKF